MSSGSGVIIQIESILSEEVDASGEIEFSLTLQVIQFSTVHFKFKEISNAIHELHQLHDAKLEN